MNSVYFILFLSHSVLFAYNFRMVLLIFKRFFYDKRKLFQLKTTNFTAHIINSVLNVK